MMKKTLLGVTTIFLLSFLQSTAQEQVLTGQIIDRDTREGITAATISVSAKIGSLTDSLGYFSIPVIKYPLNLSISHLSYGSQSFTINFHPKQKLVFQIEKVITHIPEILVSGRKLQILTKSADYSVNEFEFDDKHMWLIGMVNNRPKRTRLFKANLIGDTLGSIPVKLPANLYKDVFGNIHLQTVDSVFQLFGSKDSIFLLYGEDKETFSDVMGRYHATLGPGLVYHNSNPRNHVSNVFYIDPKLTKPSSILAIKDLPDDHSWLPPGMRQIGRVFGPRTLQLMLDQQRSYFREVQKESIFKLKDSLFVIDLKNDLLHVVGPDRKKIREVSISFFHHPNPSMTNLYIPFDEIIVDQLNYKAYISYDINNNWRFIPLNTQTGQTGTEINTPRFNAMNNIRIHGGAIYFTYPEKLYPYYQRVYRMIINNYQNLSE